MITFWVLAASALLFAVFIVFYSAEKVLVSAALLFFVFFSVVSFIAFRVARPIAGSVQELHSLAEVIDSGDPQHKAVVGITTGEGEFSRIVDVMKKTRGLIGRLNVEINGRKRMEDELRESEKRFMDVLYSSRDAILLISKGKFVDCNEATVQMLGYNNREELLKPHPSALSPSTQPDGQGSFEKADEMMKIALSQGLHRFEWAYRKANGESFPVEVSLTPIVMHGETMLYCVWTDLSRQRQDEKRFSEVQESLKEYAGQLATSLKDSLKSREILASMLDDNNQIRQDLERHLVELKRSQNMLINSEKLASLGRLVSEIAHEVNNPLMIISGNAQLSLMSEVVSGEEKNNLEIIVQECQRAKNVIRRVLRFARPSKGEIKDVEIGQSIESVVGILEKQFKLTSNVEIVRNYLGNAVHVPMDELQLQEVFMNLLNNAKEAMPRGGTITITTSLEKEFLRMDFKDTGAGMSDETMRKIMEPFFTTKETGTGIGLAVCYGIVTSHGGELRFESELGKGTTVTILLPLKKGTA